MSKRKPQKNPPKVASISAELALKLLESLKELTEHDTYESEYDGKMMTMCHFCGWLERGTHSPECPYLIVEKLIAEAYSAKDQHHD